MRRSTSAAIGTAGDGEIVVLPVNHVMDSQDPVFRTAGGSKR
jgi:hypothetical protein